MSIRSNLVAVAWVLCLATACTTTEQVTVNIARENAVFGIRHVDSATVGDTVHQLPSIQSSAKPIEGPKPIGLEIASIGIEDGAVIGVGVDSGGSFDVPTHHEVGWYKYGPTPGQFGSAVLAAHVVLNGTDGVFRHLAELQTGDDVVVRFDDGSTREFTVLGLDQYPKADLPLEEIFRREGDPQLVLITCGGEFDPATNGYRDNIVAFAAPT